MSRNSKLAIAAGTVAGVATAVALTLSTAQAGHLNSVLQAELRGREEVATGATSKRIVGDPNGRGEAYVFGVDGDPTTLCYVLVVEKIDTATAAHIHRGERGTNGPVVASLAAPFDGDAADCLTEGEGAGTPGVKFPTGEAGIVQDILENPSEYYVNVHNAPYPGGAIRGQLSEQS